MQPQDPEGYYSALSVSPTASQAEIRLSYKLLRESYKSGNRRKEVGKIRDAYQTLADPESRAEYDNPNTASAGLFRDADGKSRLDSWRVLAVVVVVLVAALGLVFSPALRAHFVTFNVGDTLYWKNTSKPVGVVLAYEVDHAFPESAAQAAYQIRPRSGEAYWLPSADLHRHGAVE